jgi:hypothetical protein
MSLFLNHQPFSFLLSRRQRWSCTMNSLNPSNWTKTTGPRPQQRAAVAEGAVSAEHRVLHKPRTHVGLQTQAPPLLNKTESDLSHPAAKRSPTKHGPHIYTTQADKLQPMPARAPGVSHPPYVWQQDGCCRPRSGVQSALEAYCFCPLERENCLQLICLISYLIF